MYLPANALKCWICNSEPYSTNCEDPFKPETFTEEQKKSSYKECTAPEGYKI